MPDTGPLTLEDIGNRRFSFYPAILNVEHNEWELRRVAWSEILVANTASGQELWIPRRFVGEVSSVEAPVMIIGLYKELEYTAGAVWPRERRLLSMSRLGILHAPPAGTSGGPRRPASQGPAHGAEAKVGRLIGAALMVAVAVIVVVVAITHRPVSYKSIEQLALQLTAEDDYNSIVRKLGTPSGDHWRPDSGGEIQYRALRFKGESYTLVLMGMDRNSARYIGALDKDWTPVHSVRLAAGGDTLAILHKLPKF